MRVDYVTVTQCAEHGLCIILGIHDVQRDARPFNIRSSGTVRKSHNSNTGYVRAVRQELGPFNSGFFGATQAERVLKDSDLHFSLSEPRCCA